MLSSNLVQYPIQLNSPSNSFIPILFTPYAPTSLFLNSTIGPSFKLVNVSTS